MMKKKNFISGIDNLILLIKLNVKVPFFYEPSHKPMKIVRINSYGLKTKKIISHKKS